MDSSRRGFLRGRSRPIAPPRPPWSVPEERFTIDCTRCGACVAACPQRVLVAGAGGFPEIRFEDAGCDFCGDCARACRSGAIPANAPQAGLPAWNFTAKIDASCLAANDVVCRSCGEACDAGAIRFAPRIGGAFLPILDADACTGCGACLGPCPTGAISRVSRAAAEEALETP